MHYSIFSNAKNIISQMSDVCACQDPVMKSRVPAPGDVSDPLCAPGDGGL